MFNDVRWRHNSWWRKGQTSRAATNLRKRRPGPILLRDLCCFFMIYFCLPFLPPFDLFLLSDFFSVTMPHGCMELSLGREKNCRAWLTAMGDIGPPPLSPCSLHTPPHLPILFHVLPYSLGVQNVRNKDTCQGYSKMEKDWDRGGVERLKSTWM